MKILIDNGHGADTPGKCSPDKRLLEYRYTREIAAATVRQLRAAGLEAELLVPETSDIPLRERCRRVNDIVRRLGKNNVLLVSIHVNAAGNDGLWHNARGWEAWTSRGVTDADRLAECLYSAARHILPHGIPVRTDTTDGDSDKEAGFAILTGTLCPACLTENLFQDNRLDTDWLLSDEGKSAIAAIHIQGITEYIRKEAQR